ncbi:hypothetical protein DFJ77DRAFT_507928 [Powellomyces hirtus]|nr:hypothetical protein DFJ77DRAFT_507928 [Powellomyces hirtus]
MFTGKLLVRSVLVALTTSSVGHAQSSPATAPDPTPAAAAPKVTQTAQQNPTYPAAAGSAAYPFMPAIWPDPEQPRGPINLPELLSSALVQDGMKRVRAVVPASLLNVEVKSTQAVLGSGAVNYVGDTSAAGMCYGQAQCHRLTAANGYQPDVQMCPGANVWGLTFDDGPTDAADNTNSSQLATADLVAALAAANNIKATFFVVGSQSYWHPEILKALYDAGHEIAVHTWTHAALTTLSNEQIVAEVLYTEAIIVRTLGVRPRFFRPAFGDIDDRGRAILGALGYTNIIWADTKDSGDSHGQTLQQVVDNVKAWFVPQPGFIGLNHNINPATTEMSIEIVKLIQAGQTVGTFPLTVQAVGQCLGVSPYTPITGASATTSSTRMSFSPIVPTTTSAFVDITATVPATISTQRPPASTNRVSVGSAGQPAAVAGLVGVAGVLAVAAGLAL